MNHVIFIESGVRIKKAVRKNTETRAIITSVFGLCLLVVRAEWTPIESSCDLGREKQHL